MCVFHLNFKLHYLFLLLAIVNYIHYLTVFAVTVQEMLRRFQWIFFLVETSGIRWWPSQASSFQWLKHQKKKKNNLPKLIIDVLSFKQTSRIICLLPYSSIKSIHSLDWSEKIASSQCHTVLQNLLLGDLYQRKDC